MRSRYARGVLEVYARGAVEVRSRCDQGTLAVQSSYARVRSSTPVVWSRYARGAVNLYGGREGHSRPPPVRHAPVARLPRARRPPVARPSPACPAPVARLPRARRFSRKLLWFWVCSTNHNPRVIVRHHLDCVKSVGG